MHRKYLKQLNSRPLVVKVTKLSYPYSTNSIQSRDTNNKFTSLSAKLCEFSDSSRLSKSPIVEWMRTVPSVNNAYTFIYHKYIIVNSE